ncbi:MULTISPECIES: metal ABC transporter permease [unclassified Carnobacterium]|uniref:metal ABC transporter permease n=1 Tax=unclassified Carnobacterium TaxID=257487 RepID=UPI0011ED8FB7|nr:MULTISPECIES: metal ABC transporter permease [unclassified Carnobacterium]KAF3302408.1 metal ABC transporter permease [Carnobacterium sp. PL26RED25]KAF3305776.1 metal ABC transporter permease [Carnobacterium sp. PL17GRE32]KAF3306110.1 metal ABC transporter permease [Carnobacterium sp. PL24RED07]
MGALSVVMITAVSCALLGVFLVLKNMAMVADALSHTVLLGIVLGYFIAGDLDSPILFVGAALFGVMTVYAIEYVVNKFAIQSDAATGLVFTLLFALAIILISKYARNVHLDVDVVLSGEVVFATLNTMEIFGILVPISFTRMFVMLVINLAFVAVTYQQLKVSIFDPVYAKSIGVAVGFLNLVLMTLVSITTVVAFDTVGAILVISLMVAPALSAHLLSKRLSIMLLVALLYGVINSVLGYYVAIYFNVSISGTIAFAGFVTFLLTLLFAPNGLIGKRFKRAKEA